ncbi:MAG: hypothetical protein ACK42Z_00515 [Candidatus Kapaibacteriota bacterium]
MKGLIVLISFVIIARIEIFAQCGCSSGQQFLPPMHWLGTAEILTTAKKRLSFDLIYKYGNGNKTYSGTQQVSNLVDYDFHLFDFFLNYGVTNYLSLDLILNYNFKKLDEYGFTRKGYGFSNLSAGIRYNLYETENSDLVVNAGLGLRAPLMKLKPIEQYPLVTQPTNGSFGAYAFGLIQYSLFKKLLNLLLFSRFDYNFHSSINYHFGSASTTSVFASYRFSKALVSMVEFRYSFLARDKYKDTLFPNSGANLLYMVPRFTYRMDNISVSPFLELPVYQNFKGEQIGTRFSLGVNFNYTLNLSKRKF